MASAAAHLRRRQKPYSATPNNTQKPVNKQTKLELVPCFSLWSIPVSPHCDSVLNTYRNVGDSLGSLVRGSAKSLAAKDFSCFG
jgi:hypothetical protein